jgi:acyl-CoA thioesterase-1
MLVFSLRFIHGENYSAMVTSAKGPPPVMSSPSRSRRWIITPMAFVVLLAGCSTSSMAKSSNAGPESCMDLRCSSAAAKITPASQTEGRDSAGRARWSLVALGDSVPSGANCNCNPYPALLAGGLQASTGHSVKAINDAADGFTTSDVLSQLTSDPTVMAHVRAADVITVEIGANDIPYSRSCGDVAKCYLPSVPGVRKALTAIVSHLRSLKAGHRAVIVLLDYWSIWLGGKYAAARGPAYVITADTMTDAVNSAIRSVALSTGAAYVDLRAAFKGPDYTDDETQFLSNDGDHPSASGHRLIAEATQRTIRKVLGN